MTRLHEEGARQDEKQRREARATGLQQSAVRRIAHRGLARGWSAWHAAWEERRRQRQMLASAGARLLRPKLAASVAHWRGAWEAARAEERSRAEALLSAAQARERGGLEAEVERLRAELEAERSGAAAQRRAAAEEAKEQAARQEEAAARQLIDRLEEEKEKRIAHLHQSAARRMGNQGILRGWTAWVDLHEEQRARRQMLASAGARLLRPKLAASLALWRQGWEAEMCASAERAAQVLRAADERKRGTVEGELAQVRAELAEARAELARSAATATAAAEDERRALHERMEAAVLTKEEEAARELLERLEEEKERRVEHLQRVAARRIGLGAVARGWSAWHAAWEERQ